MSGYHCSASRYDGVVFVCSVRLRSMAAFGPRDSDQMTERESFQLFVALRVTIGKEDLEYHPGKVIVRRNVHKKPNTGHRYQMKTLVKLQRKRPSHHTMSTSTQLDMCVE